MSQHEDTIKPLNWSMCTVSTPTSTRYFRGTDSNHIHSTGFSRTRLKCTPQFLADQGLIRWDSTTILQTTTVRSIQEEVSHTLSREHIHLYLTVNYGWQPIASSDLDKGIILSIQSLLLHDALNITWNELFNKNCTNLCT